MKSLIISKQSRRPSGLLGHVVARGMARDTARCNDRAVELLDLKPDDHVLDVGCGHGRTLTLLAHHAKHGQVIGVDFSETMCTVARQRNAGAIREGRVDVRHTDSAHLPFDHAAFDKVLTVHTIYFWPDPERQVRELYRVLRHGGRLLICYRANDDGSLTGELPDSVYCLYTSADVELLLRTVGFVDVATTTESLGHKTYTYTSGARPQT